VKPLNEVGHELIVPIAGFALDCEAYVYSRALGEKPMSLDAGDLVFPAGLRRVSRHKA
jgi:hypothetical protein